MYCMNWLLIPMDILCVGKKNDPLNTDNSWNVLDRAMTSIDKRWLAIKSINTVLQKGKLFSFLLNGRWNRQTLKWQQNAEAEGVLV